MSYRIDYMVSSDAVVASTDKRLSICYETNGFSFSVRARNRLLSIGRVSMDGSQTMAQMMGTIKEAFSKAGITPYSCGEAELIVIAEQFVWVPNDLYDKGKDNAYLSTVCKVMPGKVVCSDYNESINSHIVFAAEKDVVTSFKVAIPGLKIRCQHGVLVNNYVLDASTSKSLIAVNVRDGKSDYEVYSDKVLVLSNTYDCANFDETIYHAINLKQQFNLNEKPLTVLLCGNISRMEYARISDFFDIVGLYNGKPASLTTADMKPVANYKNALILS